MKWGASHLPEYTGPMLLDTHIWLWHLEGNQGHTMRDLVPLLDRRGMCWTRSVHSGPDPGLWVSRICGRPVVGHRLGICVVVSEGEGQLLRGLLVGGP